jgi:trehalose-phosphatase
MLDYDGTLTPIVKNPANATPSPSLVSVLRQLCSDERNQVYVISGRDREFLQHWLGFLPIGLSCEHGLFFRPYRSNKWEDHLPGMDFSWKDVVLPILEDYTERTPGSMIETKEVNLGWHFRCADPEFAEFQAKELVVHLQNIASKLPVDILFGKKVIEIRPHNVSKGASVRKILSLEPDADFVLCIGDDRTDEDMFSALEQEKEKKMSEEAKLFTCIVAKQDSLAKYCIKNQSDVLKLLKALASNADSMGEVADEGDEEDETEGAGKKSKEEA